MLSWAFILFRVSPLHAARQCRQGRSSHELRGAMRYLDAPRRASAAVHVLRLLGVSTAWRLAALAWRDFPS